MDTPHSARIAGLLDAYLAADYRWELDGRWRHLRIGDPAPEVDAAFPDAAGYALLSAWNPQSIPCDEADNRRADEALRARLAAQGYRCRAAFASAQDRSWRERGWLALDLAPDALDGLARRFGQLGTLGWRRGEPVRLRMDAAAPADAARHDCIDWLK